MYSENKDRIRNVFQLLTRLWNLGSFSLFAHFPGSDPNPISIICFWKERAYFPGLVIVHCEPEDQEETRTPRGQSTGLRIPQHLSSTFLLEQTCEKTKVNGRFPMKREPSLNPENQTCVDNLLYPA